MAEAEGRLEAKRTRLLTTPIAHPPARRRGFCHAEEHCIWRENLYAMWPPQEETHPMKTFASILLILLAVTYCWRPDLDYTRFLFGWLPLEVFLRVIWISLGALFVGLVLRMTWAPGK